MAIAVLVAWGASIAWLVARTGGDRDDASALRSAASLRLSPGDSWFQIMAGAAPLGIAGITLDTLGSGYRIHETITLDLPGPPDKPLAVDRANRTTSYIIGPDLSFRSSESQDGILGWRRMFRLEAEPTGLNVTLSGADTPLASGQVSGELPIPLTLVSYRLALTGSLGNAASRDLLTAAGWPVAVDNATYQVLRDTLVIFADSAARTPATGEWEAAHWDSAAARTVAVRSPAGPLLLQVGLRGTLVGLEYPLGLRWVRTDFDLIKRAAGPGTMATNFSTVTPDLPTLRQLSASGLTLDPDDTVAAFSIRRRDGRRIGSERVRLFATDGIGYRAEQDSTGTPIGEMLVIGEASPGPRSAPSLVQDPFSQEADPQVRAFADSFRTEDGSDVGRLARRISALRVDTSARAPIDAVGTLRAGGGSPDGISRLVVAVLRLHGFRARYALGVHPVGDTLYTHSWVEQWSPAARRWIALEPRTLQPLPATVIRLALAGSSRPADILPMVADVRFVRVTADISPLGEGKPE